MDSKGIVHLCTIGVSITTARIDRYFIHSCAVRVSHLSVSCKAGQYIYCTYLCSSCPMFSCTTYPIHCTLGYWPILTICCTLSGWPVKLLYIAVLYLTNLSLYRFTIVIYTYVLYGPAASLCAVLSDSKVTISISAVRGCCLTLQINKNFAHLCSVRANSFIASHIIG